MIWSDSNTRACVLLAILSAGPTSVAAAERLSAFFCAEQGAGSARLVVTVPGPDGVSIFPGGHKASGKIGALSWTDDTVSFVLQANQLLVIDSTSVSTLLCVDVTLQVRAAAVEVVAGSPALQSALQHEKLSFQLSVADKINEALRAQLEIVRLAPNPSPAPNAARLAMEPLCNALLDEWKNGGAKELIAIFGAKTSQYIQACRELR